MNLSICPKCGSGDVLFDAISVRPYCNDCKHWAPVNHGTKADAVKQWNEESERVHGKFWLMRQSMPLVTEMPEDHKKYYAHINCEIRLAPEGFYYVYSNYPEHCGPVRGVPFMQNGALYICNCYSFDTLIAAVSSVERACNLAWDIREEAGRL